MSADSTALSQKARSAAQSGNWSLVGNCARQIIQQDPANAEGHFLSGLAAKASRKLSSARAAFKQAISLDSARYDAAVELAGILLSLQKQTQSYRMLEEYSERLHNSPRYLDMAGTIYSNLGVPAKAWPLFKRANELQPNVQTLQANLAACCVHLGHIDEAKLLYRELLQRYPTHQRNHYQLSGLDKARDDTHIKQMKAILDSANQPPEKNIFLYYAIGKELEDLGQWEEAFSYYHKAGDAVSSVTHYDVSVDEMLIDKLIEVCSADWLMTDQNTLSAEVTNKTPIFIGGLPRTGTTLVERIISSHSKVESAGETHFLELAIQRECGLSSHNGINAAMIEAAGRVDMGRIANGYLTEVLYLLGDRPFFIEKLPENILYAGFVAKAMPTAHLVYVRRHPMDACLALYKQSYFRFAYTLDDLARYYIAHDRLVQHWRNVLGERLIEIAYEDLVARQEHETRILLNKLDLAFEPACLNFETNPTATATASSVQVRQKIHTGSVGKWRNFETQLQPLGRQLEAAGIQTD